MDLDNISDQKRTETLASLRAELSPEVNEYCTDHTLWRFCIARQLNIKDTKEMVEGWYKWRKDENIDSLPIPKPENNYSVPYPIRGYKGLADTNLTPGKDIKDTMLRMNSMFGGGCWHKKDKLGYPLYIDRTGFYDFKGIPKHCTSSELLENHYLLQEFFTNTIAKSCSEEIGSDISKQSVIFDLNGVSLGMMHWPALNMLKEMLKNDQLYFPESMHKTYFVNVPVFFLTIWSVVKVWLDPRVISKIEILGKNFREVLLKDIDADSLPAFLGGNCQCSHLPGGCVPSPPKRNFINLPRQAFSDMNLSTKIHYQSPTFSTTFDADFSNAELPVPEKSGWFGSKKSKPLKPTDYYIVVLFSTDVGRGIVFEALWTPNAGEASTQVLVYPEHHFDSHRSPTILEIKVPNDHTSGTLTMNFRIPRADEGGAPLPSVSETEFGINLQYAAYAEHDILKKYNMNAINRNFQ